MTKMREEILVCKDCGHEKVIHRVVSMYIPPRSADDKSDDKDREEEAKSIRDSFASPDECPKCKSKSFTIRPFGPEDYEKKRERTRWIREMWNLSGREYSKEERERRRQRFEEKLEELRRQHLKTQQ